MYGISVTDNTGTERTIQRTGPGAADITVDGDTINCYGWADFQDDAAMEIYFVVAPKGCFSRFAFTGANKDFIEAYLRKPYSTPCPADTTYALLNSVSITVTEAKNLLNPVSESCGEQWLASEPEHTMSQEQENDLDRIINDTADRLDAKYRAGQKEHGGNGWEMGAMKLALNTYDEDIDKVVYDKWLIESIKRIRTCIAAAKVYVGAGHPSAANSLLEEALREIDGIPGRK